MSSRKIAPNARGHASAQTNKSRRILEPWAIIQTISAIQGSQNASHCDQDLLTHFVSGDLIENPLAGPSPLASFVLVMRRRSGQRTQIVLIVQDLNLVRIKEAE